MSKKKKLQEILQGISEAFEGENDPGGSYTGKPDDGGKPIQDADDL